MIPVLLGMVGLAVDVGNLYLSHNKLQNAVDAGALAGSLELPYDPDVDNGKVETAARNMVLANYAEAEIVSIAPGTEIRSVCVKAQAEVPTMLMGALGLMSSNIEAQACAGFNHLEVVFVIDNSGSMKGTPITLTKEAVANLVELIRPDGTTSDTKIGLVGFRGKVRIGSGVDGLPAGCRNADGSVNEGIHDDFMDEYWALPYYTRRNVTLDTCSSLPVSLPLTMDKATVLSSLSKHDARGAWSGTVISEGIKWGREILTEEPPYDQGGDVETYRKIMILLTDGDTEDGRCGGRYAVSYQPNNYWTNAYFGMGDDDCHCENGGCLNKAVLDEAQLAKDAGIEIFTIRYGSSDCVDVQIMKDVASSNDGTDDHYFDAPSAYDLDDIFKKIGRQLGWRLLN